MPSVAAHSLNLLIQLGWMTQTLFRLEGFIAGVLLQPDRSHFHRRKPAFYSSLHWTHVFCVFQDLTIQGTSVLLIKCRNLFKSVLAVVL